MLILNFDSCSDISSSERMLSASSLKIICFIISFALVLETFSPEARVVPRLEEKKYLSSKIPLGVEIYLLAVDLLTVLSLKPVSASQSFSLCKF